MSAIKSNDGDLDAALVVNGQIDVRKTHPSLYRAMSSLALVNVALGGNFLVFTPTFRIYDLPNQLWGTVFLANGLTLLFFLNVVRNLRVVRAIMGIAVAYVLIIALGTLQPALEGKGSLQLPILYFGLAASKISMLLEPFINPLTARRDP